MIKVVLDTNVFVSGIFWSGPPYKILQAWQSELIRLVVSTDILDEYARVDQHLMKKYEGVDIKPFIDMATIYYEKKLF